MRRGLGPGHRRWVNRMRRRSEDVLVRCSRKAFFPLVGNDPPETSPRPHLDSAAGNSEEHEPRGLGRASVVRRGVKGDSGGPRVGGGWRGGPLEGLEPAEAWR